MKEGNFLHTLQVGFLELKRTLSAGLQFCLVLIQCDKFPFKSSLLWAEVTTEGSKWNICLHTSYINMSGQKVHTHKTNKQKNMLVVDDDQSCLETQDYMDKQVDA